MNVNQRVGTATRRRGVQALLVAVMTSVVMVASACGYGSPPTASPPPTIAATPSAMPTAQPSATPTDAVATLGSSGTDVFPGTYRSNFDPGFRLTIGEIVNLDCSAGYRCRGGVDANTPTWLDLVFGSGNGVEFMVTRMDSVTDSNGAQIAPPENFGAWIAALPGITVVTPPKAITVGGLPAEQLDVWSTHGTEGGLGIGPDHENRLIAVKVHGQQVLIHEAVGPDNAPTSHFDAAVQTLQPLLDSLTWD